MQTTRCYWLLCAVQLRCTRNNPSIYSVRNIHMEEVTCMIAKPGNPDVNVAYKEGNITGALINGAAGETTQATLRKCFTIC